jgi:hypothetical protein
LCQAGQKAFAKELMFLNSQARVEKSGEWYNYSMVSA